MRFWGDPTHNNLVTEVDDRLNMITRKKETGVPLKNAMLFPKPELNRSLWTSLSPPHMFQNASRKACFLPDQMGSRRCHRAMAFSRNPTFLAWPRPLMLERFIDYQASSTVVCPDSYLRSKLKRFVRILVLATRSKSIG